MSNETEQEQQQPTGVDGAPHFSQRATRAIVDLAALQDNVVALRALLGPATHLLAVVKADAYGHGAIPVARAALAAGSAWLGVACVDEGIALRRGGIDAPILLLGPIAPEECGAAVAHRLTVALGASESAAPLAAAALWQGLAAHVHVEIESGMNRHGILPDDLPHLLDRLIALGGLEVEGIFTHFACAEHVSSPLTERQARCLLDARALLRARTGRTVMVHAANSAGTLYWPSTHLDMVRAGIALYGYPPDAESDDQDGAAPSAAPGALPALRPVLTWRTAIARRWTLRPGDGVSYGHIFRAARATPVALLPVGYGDGLPRVLSGQGAPVLIGGRRVPIIGRVCMDQAIVDVSSCPDAAVGDEAVLIGLQGEEMIGADEIGRLAGTNSYETLCRIAPRVPRHYVGGSGLIAGAGPAHL